MRELDCRIRLTFVRRSGRGCDRPVILVMPSASGPSFGPMTPVKIAPDTDMPTEPQWALIRASLDAGVMVSLVCEGLDHSLDVLRAVAIETGRVDDPDLVRAKSAA